VLIASMAEGTWMNRILTVEPCWKSCGVPSSAQPSPMASVTIARIHTGVSRRPVSRMNSAGFAYFQIDMTV